MADDSSMRRGDAIIDALCRGGVADVVLAPGSRSAPLALAAATAERLGRLRLHVRIDERSAGYLALGIAKGSGAPVAVITTSGTAAVNLHPAVVEASYGGVPLIAVTADRPPRLRGVGANQTIDQADLFVGSCRYSRDLTGADVSADVEAIETALAAAISPHHPGPAHVNVALEEPLVSSSLVSSTLVSSSLESASPRASGSAVGSREDHRRPAEDSSVSRLIEGVERGLIVVGDTAGFPGEASDPALIERLAQRTGWPIISEPSGNASALSHSLRHGPLLLDDEEFLADHLPEVAITIGRVGLHRAVMRVLAQVDRHIVIDPRPQGFACDPMRTAQEVLPTLPTVDGASDPTWWEAWRARDESWAERVDASWGIDEEAFRAGVELDGVRIARMVVANLGNTDNLVVGPSWPVRHISAFAGPIAAQTFANRGTSGIDGVISTAWGVAVGTGRFTVAMVGDLTSIYDRNGLLAAPGEAHPHVVYVVIDNDGGGIFGELEQGAAEFAIDYERVFGTPHGAALVDLLEAPGVRVTSVDDSEQLLAQLAHARVQPGVHVIVAKVLDRSEQVARLKEFASLR